MPRIQSCSTRGAMQRVAAGSGARAAAAATTRAAGAHPTCALHCTRALRALVGRAARAAAALGHLWATVAMGGLRCARSMHRWRVWSNRLSQAGRMGGRRRVAWPPPPLPPPAACSCMRGDGASRQPSAQLGASAQLACAAGIYAHCQACLLRVALHPVPCPPTPRSPPPTAQCRGGREDARLVSGGGQTCLSARLGMTPRATGVRLVTRYSGSAIRLLSSGHHGQSMLWRCRSCLTHEAGNSLCIMRTMVDHHDQRRPSLDPRRWALGPPSTAADNGCKEAPAAAWRFAHHPYIMNSASASKAMVPCQL